jgi:hypothetical protein
LHSASDISTKLLVEGLSSDGEVMNPNSVRWAGGGEDGRVMARFTAPPFQDSRARRCRTRVESPAESEKVAYVPPTLDPAQMLMCRVGRLGYRICRVMVGKWVRKARTGKEIR